MSVNLRTPESALCAIAQTPNFSAAVALAGKAPVLVPMTVESLKVRVAPEIDCVITAGQPEAMSKAPLYNLVHFATPSGLKLDEAHVLATLAGVTPAQFATLIQGAIAAR